MNNPGFKYGTQLGIASIIIYLLCYTIDKHMLYSMAFGPIIGIVLPVFFMVLAVKAAKIMQEGFISFGEALSPAFLTFIIGTLMSVVFSYVMTTMVDPSLQEIAKEAALAQVNNMAEIFGVDAGEMEQIELAIEDNVDVGLGKILLGWAFNLIFPGILIALIISAIMKKNNTA